MAVIAIGEANVEALINPRKSVQIIIFGMSSLNVAFSFSLRQGRTGAVFPNLGMKGPRLENQAHLNWRKATSSRVAAVEDEERTSPD